MVDKTISMQMEEVPAYLRGGTFYGSLDHESTDDVIEIPSECFKINDSVSSLDEFGQLLRVLTFWGVDTIPAGLIEFCVRTELSVWDYVADEILGDASSILNGLKDVFHDSAETPLYNAIEANRSDVISYLATISDKELAHGSEMNRAANLGRLDYLQLLHSNGFSWSELTCADAATGGHMDCLRYLHEHGCPWDERVFICAIRNDDFECITYAHENGCAWSEEVATTAAEYGRLSLLRYLLECDCPISENACMKACASDHLDCLTYLHEHGVSWGSGTLRVAVQCDSTQCLRYLLQHNPPQDDKITLLAAESGKLDCLVLLHEHGYVWDEDVTNAAALSGSVEILRYAFEHDCPYNENLLKLAAEAGSLPCLQYLLEDRVLSMDGEESVMAAALVRADLSCVQYLVDMGCPFTSFKGVPEKLSQTLDADYEVKFMDCLEYIVDHGWQCTVDLLRFVSQHKLRNCWETIVSNGWLPCELDELEEAIKNF